MELRFPLMMSMSARIRDEYECHAPTLKHVTFSEDIEKTISYRESRVTSSCLTMPCCTVLVASWDMGVSAGPNIEFTGELRRG